MSVAWISFVETGVFTRRVQRGGLEESLRALQMELLENPAAGAVESGTGGLRKVRMPDPARRKGKRGGARVHYLWIPARAIIYFLYLYSKDEQDSLTKQQKDALQQVVLLIRNEP